MELIIDPVDVQVFANVYGSCDEQCSCIGACYDVK
jgi:hypothetical protein